MSLKNILLATFFLLGMIGCGPVTIYDHKENISEPWTYTRPVRFDYTIKDIDVPYELVVTVSHSQAFQHENIYVNATTIFPDGSKTTHPLSLQLTNEAGDWAGKCSSNDCDAAITMSSGAYYKSAGKYALIFDQYSRRDSLEGITALAMKITKSQ